MKTWFTRRALTTALLAAMLGAGMSLASVASAQELATATGEVAGAAEAGGAAAGGDVFRAAEWAYTINTLVMFICAVLVLFMQAGFAMLEAGMNSAKNTINILDKNVMDLSVGVILFLLLGFVRRLGRHRHGDLRGPSRRDRVGRQLHRRAAAGDRSDLCVGLPHHARRLRGAQGGRHAAGLAGRRKSRAGYLRARHARLPVGRDRWRSGRLSRRCESRRCGAPVERTRAATCRRAPSSPRLRSWWRRGTR